MEIKLLLHPLTKSIKNMKVLFIAMLMSISIVGVHQINAKEIQGIVYQASDNTALAGVSVSNKRINATAMTDKNGAFTIEALEGDELLFQAVGYIPKTVYVKKDTLLRIYLVEDMQTLDEVVVTGYAPKAKVSVTGSTVMIRGRSLPSYVRSTESYAKIQENTFMNPFKEPLSTFAADVDAASYSNIRRMIRLGNIPPKDAVRVEEMINYFSYDLKAPTNGDPVNILTELTTAPWNTQHQLLRISLKAKDIPTKDLPSSNLVFLIDVSGSMYDHNKLPLVKSSLKMLVDQLRDNDKVAIVTYAGSAGVKLESTSGDQKMKIKDAIDQLEAGGSTAGAAGIKKAYQIARDNFIKGGNNRIIMATDGDFNVGVSSDEDMETLISKERESGVHISILGYGMGNYKDSKMEILANKGHGNYAYIDNISEARKAIVTEFGGTLFTVAKDVKIQVEFNPKYVQAYRLVGYENRLLEAEDFNNDQKLGGDMGVGHAVTALYEIVPVGVKSSMIGHLDDLKYQNNSKKQVNNSSTEIATVKFRYKDPDSNKSKLKQQAVEAKPQDFKNVSSDLRFVTAVAELGMLLRNSDYKQESDFDKLIQRAKNAKGKDDGGYRTEFIQLAEDAKALMKSEG